MTSVGILSAGMVRGCRCSFHPSVSPLQRPAALQFPVSHPALCSSSTSNRALLRTLVRRCCVFVYDWFFLAPSQVFASRGFGEDSIGYNLTQMITALLIILSSLTFLVLLSFEVYRSVKFAAINEVARQVRFILAVCTLCALCWPPASSVGWGWGVDLNLSCLLSPYFSAGGGRDCRGRA